MDGFLRRAQSKKKSRIRTKIKKVGTLPAKSKVPIGLVSCDLAVLPGHPSDLTADLHGMPAILGSSDPLALRPVRHSGNAAVLSAITFWVGPMSAKFPDRKPIIRWLPPIPIGMDWRRELPTNIHIVLES